MFEYFKTTIIYLKSTEENNAFEQKKQGPELNN